MAAGCLTDSSDPGTAPAETPTDATDSPAPASIPTTQRTTSRQTTETDSPTPTESETPATPEPGVEPPTIDSQWPMLAADAGSQQWRTEVDRPAERPLFVGAEYVFLSSGTHDNRFWTFDPDTGELLGDRPRGGHDFPAEQCYLDGTTYAVDGAVRAFRAPPYVQDNSA